MTDRPTRHRTVAVDVDAVPPSPPKAFPLPWYAVAILATVAVVAAGWLLLTGATTLGWLTSPDVDLDASLFLATDFLLLAHGVPVMVGGQLVTLVPLGLPLALVVLALPGAGLAARQATGAAAPADDTGRTRLDRERAVLRVAGTTAATQGVLIAGLALVLDSPSGVLPGLLGGLVLGAVSGLWGASRAIGFDPRHAWPGWLRSVPSALGYAVLVCLMGGTAALATALIVHRDRITFIHEALDPGVAGTILLVFVQLLYLPNLILWATSWALGAGVTLGDDSLLSMSVTDVGFLPSVPVLGAVGEPGLGGGAMFWWLAVGIVAGTVASLVVVLARPRARFDETALVGGLSGVGAGLLITLLCSLAGGALGQGRLNQLGATTDQLIIVAPVLLGLSGLVGGVVLGLVRRPPSTEPAESPDPAESTEAGDSAEFAEAGQP